MQQTPPEHARPRPDAPKRPDQDCDTGCGTIARERNRFFTGKLMTARDFTDEQQYFLSRHRLHTRLLHGWGIVCGLGVRHHWNPDCRDRWVLVEPGIAIDCCGRELVLDTRRPVELFEKDADPPHEDLLVYLSYAEHSTECTPLAFDCNGHRSEAHRVREEAEIGVVPLDEVERGCWRRPRDTGRPPCRDDCDDDLPGPSLGCLDPSCPCGGRVPLAVVSVCEPTQQRPEAGLEIDDAGAWRFAPPPAYLTRVGGINWTHGGTLSLDDLDGLDRTLKVWFDRPLRAADGDATGINPYTFVVHYRNVQDQIEFVDAADGPVLEEDGCVASFRIHDRYLAPKRNLAGSDLHVALKCDFLLDCHGLAVDGDHIGGRLPSGNGREGGTFESWFRVVAAHDGARGQ